MLSFLSLPEPNPARATAWGDVRTCGQDRALRMGHKGTRPRTSDGDSMLWEPGLDRDTETGNFLHLNCHRQHLVAHLFLNKLLYNSKCTIAGQVFACPSAADIGGRYCNIVVPNASAQHPCLAAVPCKISLGSVPLLVVVRPSAQGTGGGMPHIYRGTEILNLPPACKLNALLKLQVRCSPDHPAISSDLSQQQMQAHTWLVSAASNKANPLLTPRPPLPRKIKSQVCGLLWRGKREQ